jgi:two-component system sensor histidine kinase HydH
MLNMITNKKPKSPGQIHFLIIIFFIIAGLMISSAVIELQQSKKELYQLMTKQSHSLLQSLIIASKNTLRAITYLDEVTNQRLLNNAVLIKSMYENNRINNVILSDICRENKIFRIHVFNKDGIRIYSSHQPISSEQLSGFNTQQFLQPIFNGTQDTIQIGYRESQGQRGYRFAIAISAKDRSAIVLNVDATEMLNFKRDIDFGALIRQITDGNPEIVYLALQDTLNILAASGKVKYLKNPALSYRFQKSYADDSFQTRTVSLDTIQVFEAVHPFIYDDQMVGLFRMGLSLEPIQEINKRIYRRLIVISFILIIIGFVLLVYLFTRQRLNILQRQYTAIETYSSNIISHVSDAIIVLDSGRCIKIFNDAAEMLFKKNRNKILGTHLNSIFDTDSYRTLLEEPSLLKHMDCLVEGKKLNLLISKSLFEESDGNRNTILVIRDLTEQKQLEAQLERKQRLTAMGELASGVAHEIRNPLNTIGTIVQQLNKDFEPVNNSNEYHELTELVHSEVKRINDTVQDFLRFARPEPIEIAEFSLQEFLKQLHKQYQSVLAQNKISLNIKYNKDFIVKWDERKIKQVFINLLQNSIEAIDTNGNIDIIIIDIPNNELEIRFSDDGPGLDQAIRDKIFNLYFTTKAKGTGIGLSIVQRIIYEHNGVISIDENIRKGTTFIIHLPIILKRINSDNSE